MQRLGGDRRGARRAPRAASRRCSPIATRTCGCSCPTTREHALSALYALGAPIDERRDTDDGVLIRAKLSHRDSRRFARYLVAGDDLGSPRPRDASCASRGCATTRCCPRAPTRRRRARSQRVRGGHDRTGGAGARPDRARGRDPGGSRRARRATLRARAPARHLDRQHARGDRRGLPRRGAGAPAQHRSQRSRSRSSRGCGSRSSSSCRCAPSTSSRSPSSARRSAANGGFGSSGVR